jgi:hypothetical protein
MLSNLLKCVYFDPKLIVKVYLNRCKRGVWKKEHTQESLKCDNLEGIIEADLVGKEEPNDITLEDYVVNEVE